MSENCQIEHRPEPHSHPEHPDHHLRSLAIRRIKLTFYVGLALMIFEIVGSVKSHSLALFADAFHVAGDLLSVGITLLAAHLAEKPQSKRRSYGYYRLEVIAALANGTLLLVMAAIISKEAYERFVHPAEIHATSMMGFAIIGLIANLFMLFWLKPVHHHNLNLRSAYLHILGDTLSSVAVIVGAFLIYLTGSSAYDSAASALVSVLLATFSVKLIWDSIHVLLEGTPKHMDPDEIEMILRKHFPAITNIHDFHIWEITSHLFAMTAHIEANVLTLKDTENLIDGMNALIQKRYGIGHTTFQVEAVVEKTKSKGI